MFQEPNSQYKDAMTSGNLNRKFYFNLIKFIEVATAHWTSMGQIHFAPSTQQLNRIHGTASPTKTLKRRWMLSC